MSLRVLPDPPEDGDSLHDEVQAMFKDEARKHKSEARKTWNIPSGYYDNKKYFEEAASENGSIDFNAELFAIKRQKFTKKKRKGKK